MRRSSASSSVPSWAITRKCISRVASALVTGYRASTARWARLSTLVTSTDVKLDTTRLTSVDTAVARQLYYSLAEAPARIVLRFHEACARPYDARQVRRAGSPHEGRRTTVQLRGVHHG